MSILHRFWDIALIAQYFKRSPDLKCTAMLQNFNMWFVQCQYSFVQSANQIWNVYLHPLQRYGLGPKCRNEPRDPDHAHLADSQHDKANTSRGQVVYEISGLQL